jgi:hypothetical protein
MVEFIRQAIRESGLTLVELGKAAEVNPTQLYRFVSGERTLTLPVVARVLEVLGLEVVRARPPMPPPSGRRPRGRPKKEPSAGQDRPEPKRPRRKGA